MALPLTSIGPLCAGWLTVAVALAPRRSFNQFSFGQSGRAAIRSEARTVNRDTSVVFAEKKSSLQKGRSVACLVAKKI
jgi:hypothetical protein